MRITRSSSNNGPTFFGYPIRPNSLAGQSFGPALGANFNESEQMVCERMDSWSIQAPIWSVVLPAPDITRLQPKSIRERK